MDILLPFTVKDIVRELGVSIATVSRALKDNPSISKEQREKVQACMREHNFYPNTIVESLRNSKVKPLRAIGVIVPQLSRFYFSSILSGIEEEASTRNYRIMVAQSNEKYDCEVRIYQDYFESKARGVTVSQTKDTIRYEYFQKLVDHGMPLVFYNCICTGVGCGRVVVDDYTGTSNAVTHPTQTGCRRIAYYGTLMIMEISKNRYNGYRDAITRYGLKVDDCLFRICDNRADAELTIPELLSQEEVPDTFFTVNDDTAVGILYVAKRMGYRIPEDISICGFINGDRAKACDPMFTTVGQRDVRIGEGTANILISRTEGLIPSDKIEKKVMKIKLIIRGTMRQYIVLVDELTS